MKSPAFVGTVLGRLKNGGLKAAETAVHALAKAKEFCGRIAAGLSPRILKTALIALAGSAAIIAAALTIGMVVRGYRAERAEPAIALSGTALASELLLPDDGAWPYPLALEPKGRYTDTEADAIRPDLGAVDVSELTRRRKADLEAIFGAVD